MSKLLVVEDNPSNLYVARELLRKYGYDVCEATTGEQALNVWESEEISLILMDIQMPVMNGWDVTKVIRERETKSGRGRTPIIALTAHAILDYKEKCFDMDMDGYVTKPIIILDLVETIERTLIAVAGSSN
ncbi:response regulator [Puniceicoccaceae bacterium K14]|nr:response regulator [Puniceicoccaceae bacterium K14]